MGTVFSIDVRSPGVGPTDVEDVVRWLHWVDRTFSTYRSDSEISRLARGEMKLDDSEPEVREVIDRCRTLSEETDGYFSAWAAGPLDPSGYVKGWAIERASEMLAAAGSINHCVNGGGDVQCAGSAAPGQPWQVGIADPLRPGGLAGVFSGDAIAVATSGTAERGSHISDPHTRTQPGVLVSVTLAGPSLSTVDAYATAAFAMGARAPSWIESLPEVQALVIYRDGTRWTPATCGQVAHRQLSAIGGFALSESDPVGG
jgi:thiamine biosynthesis lipoprotein